MGVVLNYLRSFFGKPNFDSMSWGSVVSLNHKPRRVGIDWQLEGKLILLNHKPK